MLEINKDKVNMRVFWWLVESSIFLYLAKIRPGKKNMRVAKAITAALRIAYTLPVLLVNVGWMCVLYMSYLAIQMLF